ncbi:MAG: TIGR01777 family oxidoreductase [Acidimicrobiales bacterium]
MKVLVSGSSGFVGSALVPALEAAGHEVVRLVRHPAGSGECHWDIGAGKIDSEALAGVEGVVHLAGAGIGERRWTEEVKAAIQDSRIDGTRLLCGALAAMGQPPSVLVSGSAIGYYGDRGAEILDESSSTGTGFLAEVCVAWEAATADAKTAGVRVVHLRTGVVLGPGGILTKTLPLFKRGMGGRLGSGNQYMSWVSLDDEVGAILHALHDTSVSGPLNATAPNPVTNLDFTSVLAKVLSRPAPLPVPAFALSGVLGKEMVTDMVLASQRVMPTRLQSTGYSFTHPELEGSLRAITAKPAS